MNTAEDIGFRSACKGGWLSTVDMYELLRDERFPLKLIDHFHSIKKACPQVIYDPRNNIPSVAPVKFLINKSNKYSDFFPKELKENHLIDDYSVTFSLQSSGIIAHTNSRTGSAKPIRITPPMILLHTTTLPARFDGPRLYVLFLGQKLMIFTDSIDNRYNLHMLNIWGLANNIEAVWRRPREHELDAVRLELFGSRLTPDDPQKTRSLYRIHDYEFKQRKSKKRTVSTRTRRRSHRR